MNAYNQHWYSINGSIAYPLEENAGDTVPTNLIVDLSLRWPEALGQRAFLSAICVTPSLVTVTIQAVNDNFTPLAVVSVPQPVDVGRVYALEAQSSGVLGWIVFGPGVSDPAGFRGRLSAAQGLLTPRAARAYRPAAVTSLKGHHAGAGLTGPILLKAQEPLTLTKEEREIAGQVRDVIVVRLVDNAATAYPTPAAAALAAGQATESIFQKFAGPCGRRPESRSCPDPQPIEFVNSVAPDCDGVVTIEFQGYASLTQLTSPNGALVDSNISLANCPTLDLPDESGALFDDYVAPDAETPTVFSETPQTLGVSDTPSTGDSLSLSQPGFASAPYLDCFTSEGTLTVQAGLWTYALHQGPADSGPCGLDSQSLSWRATAFATNTAAVRNVATVAASHLYHRRITTSVLLRQGPAGSLHNGGLVFNYRPVTGPHGVVVHVYFLAEIDYDRQELRVSFFDGHSFTELASVQTPGIRLNAWYRIQVVTTPGNTLNATTIAVTLDGDIATKTLTTSVTIYEPDHGAFGVGSDRSLARFSYLLLEEV